MQRLWGAAFVAMLWLAGASAGAQGTTDMVRLRDGSFARGTIIESTSDHVVLMLPTGETRSYAQADIVSAGPDGIAPVVPAPPAQAIVGPPIVATPAVQAVVVAPTAPTSHVRVTTNLDTWSLHRIVDTTSLALRYGGFRGRGFSVDRFEIVCTMPCEADVPAGTYQLAISRDGSGSRRRIGRPVAFSAGPFSLDIQREDRSGIRAAGFVTLSVLAAAAIAMFVVSFLTPETHCGGASGLCFPDLLNVPLAIGAGAALAVGLAVGLPLAFLSDIFTID